MKHLHSLEIFTAGHSIVDLESTALHDLKGLLEFESTNTYSQAPSLYFIYNLDKNKVKEVMSLENIRCVLNASENVSELVNGSKFVFYNKKSNQFLNLDETDLEFEEYLITSSGNKEVLQDTIQKIKVISSRIFAELNQDNSLEHLPQLLQEFDKKYWGKILDFTGNYFDIEIPNISQLQLPDVSHGKEQPQEKLQDFSNEYTILVSTNKNIGKEFVQLLHDYRSKKVNSSHLVMEQLFNPVELYNYLRNHHWKEGIPESFVKEWSEMGLSQYQLTETDSIEFESILTKLGISIPIPRGTTAKRKVVSSTIIEPIPIEPLHEAEMPSIQDFPKFKLWVREMLGRVEDYLGLPRSALNSELDVAKSTTHKLSNKRKGKSLENLSSGKTGSEKIIVDLTDIMYEDVDEDRKLRTSSILRIKDLLISKGFDPSLVVDASTGHCVDDEEEFERLKENKIFKQAPAGRKADRTVLMLGRKSDCRFITNDLYRNYRDEFGKGWIEGNRITLILADGQWLVEYPEPKI